MIAPTVWKYFGDVRKWCHENGHDKRLRIVLCGYAGEGHESLEADGWTVVPWKARGGYGSHGNGTEGRNNAARERLWISPHCVQIDRPKQADLFQGDPHA